MIEASKLRAGMTFVTNDGKLIKVLEASHHKPGKGNTIMRMKLRDVRSGSTFDDTYRPEDKFEQAVIETVTAQYLYSMDGIANFMNNETYEQSELTKEQLGDALKYLKENMDISIMMFQGTILGVDLPNSVDLEVIECDPGVRGDTATGATKMAKLETGYSVRVPLFINQGDVLRIDTRTGNYMERA